MTSFHRDNKSDPAGKGQDYAATLLLRGRIDIPERLVAADALCLSRRRYVCTNPHGCQL